MRVSPRGYVAQAALLWALLCTPVLAAKGGTPDKTDPVIPAEQEDILAEMLGRGALLPGGCKFADGQAEPTRIKVTYECAAGAVIFELRHPSKAPADAARTAQFALMLSSGSPPEGLADTLLSRIRSRETAFGWKWTPRRSTLETILLVAVILLPTVAGLLGCAQVGLALHRRWRDVAASRVRHRRASAVGVAAIRITGLLAIAFISVRGAAARTDPLAVTLATLFGVMSLTGFLWLIVSGFFGYGSARRGDWIGLVPFFVALTVREIFTLHSVQEIEIQFAQGPIGRHSLVYPLFQMFFVPIVGDTQSFTMHMNGILGALACLGLYLFIRQRLPSRAAGFLCALFLATDPLVARFAPTDGPYALLLAAWFSGLALLSADALDARSMVGGATLLGIAATTRIEGVVLVLASLLMLDAKKLVAAARRNPLATGLSVLIIAALGAVQMYFLLPFHLGNGPWIVVGFDSFRRNLFWLTTHDDYIFAMLTVVGAISGLVSRWRLGLLAYFAMVVVLLPVANSTYNVVALHRLTAARAVQTIVVGIGAYSLMMWLPWPSRWRWVAVVPGALAALGILVHHRSDLNTPYVFNEEYELVRRHFGRAGVRATNCTLMTFNSVVGAGDIDIHDFGQVVPGVKVIDCRRTDCAAAAGTDGCFYYVRSAACYYSDAGIAPGCEATGVSATRGRFACMDGLSAAFEQAVDLQPIEVRTIDILQTFADYRQNYPQKAEVGLFRVRSKSLQ
jgi:hypothetical protein